MSHIALRAEHVLRVDILQQVVGNKKSDRAGKKKGSEKRPTSCELHERSLFTNAPSSSLFFARVSHLEVLFLNEILR